MAAHEGPTAPTEGGGRWGGCRPRGGFTPLADRGDGEAAVVRLADGGLRLTLLDLDTDPGPDLRVLLDRHGTVVIWCRAFSVAFAQAPLAAS